MSFRFIFKHKSSKYVYVEMVSFTNLSYYNKFNILKQLYRQTQQ